MDSCTIITKKKKGKQTNVLTTHLSHILLTFLRGCLWIFLNCENVKHSDSTQYGDHPTGDLF